MAATEQEDPSELWRSLNRPGVAKFTAELRRRGYADAAEVARKTVESSGAKQIFAGPPKYEGKILAEKPDGRWAMDVMIFNQPSRQGFKSVLVAQDIFTRYAFAEPMPAGRDGHTIAFQRILDRTSRRPEIVTTDKDTGFRTALFEETLEKAGVQHHQFTRARNDIATVDRLIGLIKRAVAEEQAETGEGDWTMEMVRGIIKGHSQTGHVALTGAAPEDLDKEDSAL